MRIAIQSSDKRSKPAKQRKHRRHVRYRRDGGTWKRDWISHLARWFRLLGFCESFKTSAIERKTLHYFSVIRDEEDYAHFAEAEDTAGESSISIFAKLFLVELNL